MRKSFVIAGFAAALLGLALPQASFAQTGPSKTQVKADDLKGPPDATLTFEAKQLRLIFGGARGKGVLNYKGKAYPFTMQGATIGGAGYTEVEGTGIVHRLKRVEDFPGVYSGIGLGASLAKGLGHSSYQNNNGVVVTTHANAVGVALNLGISSMNVKMGK